MLPAHEATTVQLTDCPGTPSGHSNTGGQAPCQTLRAGRVSQAHGQRRPTRPRLDHGQAGRPARVQ